MAFLGYGYVYDSETGLYYLQSRYYNPEMGRFISADSYASTGQGVLVYNMYAYCGNNPVTRIDSTGDSWVVIGVGLAVAGITGLSNGYSSYVAGGQFWPAFGIGIGAGGIGYGLSLATTSPIGLISIRTLTSLGSNLLTANANSALATPKDWLANVWDATINGVFSTIAYYYNPFIGYFPSNAFNAVADGFVDMAESWLYGSPKNKNTPQINSSTNRSSVRKRPQSYVVYDESRLLH